MTERTTCRMQHDEPWRLEPALAEPVGFIYHLWIATTAGTRCLSMHTLTDVRAMRGHAGNPRLWDNGVYAPTIVSETGVLNVVCSNMCKLFLPCGAWLCAG